MRLLNKKGMTLFELLAVIVILGIVAAIAFPTVNGLIENSRKEAFANNANNFIKAAIVDAKADYTSHNVADSVTYTITGKNTFTKASTNYGATAGFELDSDLTGATIVVAVTTDGVVTVTLTANFSNGTYYTHYTADTTVTEANITKDNVTKTAPTPW